MDGTKELIFHVWVFSQRINSAYSSIVQRRALTSF
jgi:hypothetical protein